MGDQLAGGSSSWCPELEYWTTHRRQERQSAAPEPSASASRCATEGQCEVKGKAVQRSRKAVERQEEGSGERQWKAKMKGSARLKETQWEVKEQVVRDQSKGSGRAKQEAVKGQITGRGRPK